jgi:hypothetical protein
LERDFSNVRGLANTARTFVQLPPMAIRMPRKTSDQTNRWARISTGLAGFNKGQ